MKKKSSNTKKNWGYITCSWCQERTYYSTITHWLCTQAWLTHALYIAIHVVMPSWYVGSMRCFPDCCRPPNCNQSPLFGPGIPLVYLFSSFGVLKFMLEKHYFLRWILIKQEKKKTIFFYLLILPKMLIKYYIKRA